MRAGGVGALLMIALLIMEGQPENGGGGLIFQAAFGVWAA